MATRCCSPALSRSGVAVGQGLQPGARQQLLATRSQRRPAFAGQLSGQNDVLQHGQDGDEVEELEDDADVVAAEARELALAHWAKFAAGDADAAGVGPVDAAQHVEQRALAAAAFAEEDEELARGHLKLDLVEHTAAALALAEGTAQAMQFDNGLVCAHGAPSRVSRRCASCSAPRAISTGRASGSANSSRMRRAGGSSSKRGMLRSRK